MAKRGSTKKALPKADLPPLQKSRPEPEQEVKEFIEIGGSPTPGITLRQVLRGHTGSINRIAWSPDGRYLASPSHDETIRIWDVERGECIAVLTGHEGTVYCVAWSPDGKMLASGSSDVKVRLWDAETGKSLQNLEGHSDAVFSVAWSPDGRLLASGGGIEDGTIILWNVNTWKPSRVLHGHTTTVYDLVWLESSTVLMLASSSGDNTIRIWDAEIGEISRVFKGHSGHVVGLSWWPGQHQLASASGDNSVRIWNIDSGLQTNVIEGHTDYMHNVSFSADGLLLASKSRDNTVRFWSTSGWSELTKLKESQGGAIGVHGLLFHPTLKNILATLGELDTVVRIWDVDAEVLFGNKPATEPIRYTTAKLVLVGDSGVGKTGLGWRLAHDEFKVLPSTHGQQFWVVPELGKTRADGTECEAVLWDVAGQHVFRPIHSIFLDNVDASLVLFDASNRQDPLKGVEFWLNQLAGKTKLPPSILVGAKVDVSPPNLTPSELDQFCKRYGISGGYISTSAVTGEGLGHLLETLKAQVPWDQMTTTVTTVTFKRIKDYVLALKEKPDRKDVLVRPAELRQQLQATDKDWQFTDAEMVTAVGHLQTHGYVTILHSSSGEDYILLTPDLLVSLASSIVLLADKNPRELGAISETELLQGKYPFDELKGLKETEQHILLDAAILRFLEHSICVRETLGNDTLLIFPGLIKQKRPLQDDIPSTDDISYIARGRVENIYPMLVVLLGYTPSFTRINQWQNQAQYEMKQDEICGFRLIEEREGEIELVLYYGEKMPKEGRQQFQELFEQFLYRREVEVTPFPPVSCPKGHRQERATVVKRLREGKKFLHCDECGAKTDLPSIEAPQTIGIGVSAWLQREEATARLRSVYEAHLVRIKGYRRQWAAPRCYISCISVQAKWAEGLKHDFNDAGIYVVETASQVQPDDWVILLDSPAYQQAWKKTEKLLEEDIQLIKARLTIGKRNLISIVLEGKSGSAAPHDIDDCKPGDFCDETHYPVSLFDLVLNLYAIPLNHTGFAPLRASLHHQWEQTLAGKGQKGELQVGEALKIFVSYSHKDEEFKDELVTMLAGLQRRGVIDAWQDRRIEEGDEWYQEIQDAMANCDMAVLLVSSNFIASRFIQDEELPRLLKRRIEEGLRVVPVIVKPCLWQSEPVLKDIQALPRHGKPVITFSKGSGARDQVWTEIAQAIEKRAKGT